MVDQLRTEVGGMIYVMTEHVPVRKNIVCLSISKYVTNIAQLTHEYGYTYIYIQINRCFDIDKDDLYSMLILIAING